MTSKKSLDLRSQLSALGVTPETKGALEPMSEDEVNLVSGGFGQIVGFAQGFSETSGPGPFTQSFYQLLHRPE